MSFVGLFGYVLAAMFVGWFEISHAMVIVAVVRYRDDYFEVLGRFRSRDVGFRYVFIVMVEVLFGSDFYAFYP